MKNRGFTILILAALLLVGSACQPGVKAGLGEEVSLAIGQSVSITGENLRVSFKGVSEDSRCPTGATCVWQGRVICLVKVSQGGAAYLLSFIQPGLTDQSAEQDFLGYRFAFSVEPYPEVGKEIASSQYRLLLTVSKR